MGLINSLLNKNVKVVNNDNNAVPLKNVLIATLPSTSVSTNGNSVILSNIISPSSLPISNLTFEITITTTALISASTNVTTNPIENIFKSFSLKSNPTDKIFYNLDGTLSEMSLFQRYMKIDGEFNQSSGVFLPNAGSTSANPITGSATWNYSTDFSIATNDANRSGLQLNLSFNSLADFYANNSSASDISINVVINVYGTYENHNFDEVELIKTIIPVTTTGIARIGYLLAQGKKVLAQYMNYGADSNIIDINFSTNGGRNYLYNKLPMSKLISKENIEYKNSLSNDNIPISNQSRLDGVNSLFTPMFITDPLVYLEVNFGALPSVSGYEVNGTSIIPNSTTNISNECILYQIVLRE